MQLSQTQTVWCGFQVCSSALRTMFPFAFSSIPYLRSLLLLSFQMVGNGAVSSLQKYKVLVPKYRLGRGVSYSWHYPRRCLCSPGPLSW